MRLLAKISFGFLVLSLLACSHEPYGDYKAYNKSVPSLKIPKGNQFAQGNQYYPVPEGLNMAKHHEVSLEPPGSHLDRYRKKKK